MNKIKIIILSLLFITCDKKNEIESVFIAHKNEYWEYRNYCNNSGRGIYFQFREGAVYDQYLQYINEGFSLFNSDGDLIFDSRSWSVKNDSTFVLDKEAYKIEKYSNKEILLSYFDSGIKDKKCFILLSKWIVTPKGPKPLNVPNNIKK